MHVQRLLSAQAFVILPRRRTCALASTSARNAVFERRHGGKASLSSSSSSVRRPPLHHAVMHSRRCCCVSASARRTRSCVCFFSFFSLLRCPCVLYARNAPVCVLLACLAGLPHALARFLHSVCMRLCICVCVCVLCVVVSACFVFCSVLGEPGCVHERTAAARLLPTMPTEKRRKQEAAHRAEQVLVRACVLRCVVCIMFMMV